MTDEELIEAMAQAMARSIRDPEHRHYTRPAKAALEVVKQHYRPSIKTEQAGAGPQPQQENQHG